MSVLPWLRRLAWVVGLGCALLGQANPPTSTGIRNAHLARLDERMMTAAEDLREQCRFESDIPTAPPVGYVALTFDDGPDAEHTEQILAVLEHYDVPGTFFLIGDKAARRPDLVSAIRSSGKHLVGSHTWSHPNFHELETPAQQQEIERGIAALPADLGDRYFRYPFGNSTCFSNDLLHSREYHITGWHVDSCDWAFDRTGTVDAKEALSCGVATQYRGDFVGHVTAALRARRGGIVLLHEIHAITATRLSELIEEIRQDGFQFVRIDNPRFQESLR